MSTALGPGGQPPGEEESTAHGSVDQLSLGALMHKIKSPLTIIRGIGQVTLERWGSLNDAEKFDFVTRIVHSAEILSQNVEKDLTALRERSFWKCAIGPLHLRALVQDAVRDLTSYYPQIHCQLYLANPVVRADGDVVRILLHHLVDNAARYGREGPIHVEVDENEVEGFLRVINWGESTENLLDDDVFQAGWHSDEVSVHNEEGFGLGLWIVKSYATAMGGDCTVNQETTSSSFSSTTTTTGSQPTTAGSSSSSVTSSERKTVFTVALPKEKGGNGFHGQGGNENDLGGRR